MRPELHFNDAWDPICLSDVDVVIEFFEYHLQATHPLRAFKLFPLAKCWRKYRYLIEGENASDLLWVLDMHKKKRIKGKTCYYFKRIESQEELDSMMMSDCADWVQYMKEAGAWEED